MTRLKITEHHHNTHKRDEAVESKDWFKSGGPMIGVPIGKREREFKGESSGM